MSASNQVLEAEQNLCRAKLSTSVKFQMATEMRCARQEVLWTRECKHLLKGVVAYDSIQGTRVQGETTKLKQQCGRSEGIQRAPTILNRFPQGSLRGGRAPNSDRYRCCAKTDDLDTGISC